MTTDTTRDTIKQLVIEHMPTAAYHSGLGPNPAHHDFIAQVTLDRARPEYSGLSGLRRWLDAQGIAYTPRQAQALHHHWLDEYMREVA